MRVGVWLQLTMSAWINNSSVPGSAVCLCFLERTRDEQINYKKHVVRLISLFLSAFSGVMMNNNINSQQNNNTILNAINNNGKDLDADQPDPDFIKMFVGQVPRSMDEAQLKEMFEEFGRVHTINVLRDKVTGLSKGKCKIK